MLCGASIFATAMASPTPLGEVGLSQSFTSALKRSEVIATQSELVTQAEEKYQQAKGAVFPTINGVATYFVQDPPVGALAASSPSEQTTVKVTGQQPLFRGFRDYAAIHQTNLQVTAQMAAKKQAGVLLYHDVAKSLYQILSLEQDLRDFVTEIEIDEKRVAELEARARIGKSRVNDVLTVKSAVATLKAQVDQTQGNLVAARETFAFLTGFDPNVPVRDEEMIDFEKLPPLESYMSRVEQRPDVKAARDSLESVGKNVQIARGGHFPSVDLSGNYYFKRPGLAQDQRWDMQITGTLPLFAGGAVNSQMRQAVSQERQSELGLEQTRRQARQELRSLYEGVRADIAQVQSLTIAAEATGETYKVQVRDYKYGLVSNIDVLQAIQAWQTAKRSLERARLQSRLDFVRLEASAALRPKGE